MKSFKNKLLTALLFFSLFQNAAAQDKVYLIPPVHLLPLKKMATDAYGLDLPASTEILNQDVWKNASYSVTAAKFKRVPDNLPAEGERLRLALLKLAAEPPQGTENQSFITLKLRSLFDRAQFDDAYALMQKIPENIRTDTQKKIYADILLTKNLQTACFLKETDTTPFWQKLSAVCAALDKEENKAFFALDLLKEQNQEEPFFVNAVDFFLYGKPLTAPPEEITPLSVAVWRACGRSPDELKPPENALWFNALIVRDETVPVEKRLKIAESLVQTGILPASKLRTLYQLASIEKHKDQTPLPPELLRAQYVQQAAALSSQITDNLKKQAYIKKALLSAKASKVAFAFSAAIKDILETVTPDPDTLKESAEMIEAFVLAGLNEQAIEWYKKAALLFPVSETTAYGWYFAELAQTDKDGHFFISALENMMSYAENNKKAGDAFVFQIDRLMLAFQRLDMIHPDDVWHYTTFDGDPVLERLADREKKFLPAEKPVGDIVLEALSELNGTYAGLIKAVSLLSETDLNREAALLTAQSMDLILHRSWLHE